MPGGCGQKAEPIFVIDWRRMYRTETIEKLLKAVEEGMSVKQAAELVGVCNKTAYNWCMGQFPQTYVGKRRKSCIISSRKKRSKGAAMDQKRPHEILWEQGLFTEMQPLEIENMLMREVLDYLKVSLRVQMLTSTRLKVEFCENLRREKGLPLHVILNFWNISKSTYEYNRARLNVDKDAQFRALICEIFYDSNSTFGYRRIWAKLREKGVRVSEKRVRRIMQQEGLYAIYLDKKISKYNSYKGEISEAPENLVQRNFHAEKPNELWLTDVTEFKLPNGQKVYLSPVIDCFDGCPISWSIRRNPTAELVNSSLKKALKKRKAGEKTVIHSDRGVHYRWKEWVDICDDAGLIRSMSAKGCSPDNSACEGFFGTLKNEFFHYRNWKNVDAEEFMKRMDEYLTYFCESRIKQSLGWLSPNDYRRSLNFAV